MKTILILLLTISPAFAMAPTQFGTYSQAYLDRQKCKADAKAAGTSEALCNARIKRR